MPVHGVSEKTQILAIPGERHDAAQRADLPSPLQCSRDGEKPTKMKRKKKK